MPEGQGKLAPAAGGTMLGRRILVTGGSRGIAAAIASRLVEEGAVVGINYAAEADQTAGLSRAAKSLAEQADTGEGALHLLERDLSIPGAGRELAERAEALLGEVDGLVLSASSQVNRPLAEQGAEDIWRQVRLNLLANIELLQTLLPGMAARGFGRVLSIGSVQEVAPSPEMPIYAMTKAGLRNLVEGLAVHYAPSDVTLNTLSPGLIATDRNQHRRADPAAWNSLQASANPLGRAGTPADLVASALHLLSREAGFITGATLYATGGSHIPQPDRGRRSSQGAG